MSVWDRSKGKKKSPLEGLGDALKKMTPEELKKWREEVTQRVKEQEKNEEDKRNLQGKYDPKNIPLGKCMLCSGDIVQKVTHSLLYPDRIGGYNRSVPRRGHLYCKQCGLIYEFVPSTVTVENHGVGNHNTLKTFNSQRNLQVENDEEDE